MCPNTITRLVYSKRPKGLVLLCSIILTVFTSVSYSRILNQENPNNKSEDNNKNKISHPQVLPDEKNDLKCDFDLISMYVSKKERTEESVSAGILQVCPHAKKEKHFCCSAEELNPLVDQLKRLESRVSEVVSQYQTSLAQFHKVIGDDHSESKLKHIFGNHCNEDFSFKSLENFIKTIPKGEGKALESNVAQFLGIIMTMHSSFPCTLCSPEFSASVDVDKRKIFIDKKQATVYFNALIKFGLDAIEDISNFAYVLSRLHCMTNGSFVPNKYFFTDKTDEMANHRQRVSTETEYYYVQDGIYQQRIEYSVSDNFYPNDTLFMTEIMNVMSNVSQLVKKLTLKFDLVSELTETTKNFPSEYFHPKPRYTKHKIGERLLLNEKNVPQNAENLDEGLYKKEVENMMVAEDSKFNDRLTVDRVKENTNQFQNEPELPKSPPRKFQGANNFPNEFRVFKALRAGELKHDLETFDVWYVWDRDENHELENGADFVENHMAKSLFVGVYYDIHSLVNKAADYRENGVKMSVMYGFFVFLFFWFK